MIKVTNQSVPGAEMPAYDYSALESLGEFRSLAAEADLIWAVDTSTSNNHAIVFGGRVLRNIVERGEGRPLGIVSFALDFRTDHVEHLLAAIGTVKGHFEWNGEEHKTLARKSNKPRHAPRGRRTRKGQRKARR